MNIGQEIEESIDVTAELTWCGCGQIAEAVALILK